MNPQAFAKLRVFRNVFTAVLGLAFLLPAVRAQTFSVLHNFGDSGNG